MKNSSFKIWLLCLALGITMSSCSQSNYYQSISEAHGYYHTNEYKEALLLFQKAFKKSKPQRRDLIVAAYCAAHLNQTDQTIKYLDAYFSLNSKVYIDLESIISNPVFTQVKSHKDWKTVINKAQVNNELAEATLNIPLKNALEALYALDQQTRNMALVDSLIAIHGWPSKPVSAYLKKMNAQDKKNLVTFKELVPVGTIPGISEVGAKANLTAWLIIQHNSTAVQKDYLEALKASAEVGESKWSNVAGTIDRIMIEEEGVQLYGTQFGMDSEGNGYVKPLKDSINVNKRREKVGLIALEHDVKRHGITLKN